MEYYYKIIKSPVNNLKLIASDVGLAAILWGSDDIKHIKFLNFVENKTHPLILESEQQLQEYFDGSRKSFTINLDFIGTEFQKKVWNALLTIPYGETRNYAQIAKQIGHGNAYRAVASANGKNPIGIIIPCHRVIGSSGKLAGFAGGLEVKAYLLDLESKNVTCKS